MKFTTALVASAIMATASAYGSMAVVNHCEYDIYLWSVAGGRAPSQMFTLPGSQAHIGYKETYRYIDKDNGVSLKISPNYLPGGSIPPTKITQLEYTVPLQDGNGWSEHLYYDLSWVDGNPWKGVAMTMQTSGSCASGSCGGAAGTACDVGYLWSTDDTKTHACDLDKDIVWTFCNGDVQTGLPDDVPRGEVQANNPWFTIKRDVTPEKREAIPEAAPEAEPMAVCVGAEGGVATLCDEPAEPAVAPAPAPATTLSTSTKAAVQTPAPVVAIQQKPKDITTSTTSTPPPPAPTPSASPAPALIPDISQAVANYIGTTIRAPLSLLQLKNIEHSGVTCWQSVEDGNTCGVNSPSKRDTQSSHRHNHLDFHRRNRIVKSSA